MKMSIVFNSLMKSGEGQLSRLCRLCFYKNNFSHKLFYSSETRYSLVGIRTLDARRQLTQLENRGHTSKKLVLSYSTADIAPEDDVVKVGKFVDFEDNVNHHDFLIRKGDIVYFDDVSKSALETCEEDVSHISPPLKPSFNFAAYINTSNVLQRLLALGVDFYKLESKKDVPDFLLQLDYERDVEPRLNFLCKYGVPKERFGRFITKAPTIFKEDLEDLQIRINYLESKRFTPDMIARIIDLVPMWLLRTTKHIDNVLGYFQKEYSLNGDQIRQLITRFPQIVIKHRKHLVRMKFTIKEEMGFSDEECKLILLNRPHIFVYPMEAIKNRFMVLNLEMGIPHSIICKQADALNCRESRLRERHGFLKELGRNQYDPEKPNYVSLLALISGTDLEFCTNVAKSSIEIFNLYLKKI